MINKTYRRAVLLVLILMLFILSAYQGNATTKILHPKIYQHLDIGVVFGHQGKDWSKEKYLVGGSYSVSKTISMGGEIEVVGAYPLVGNESKFDFNDRETCTHNILPQYSFSVNYAPYSASLSGISARSNFNKIDWSFNAHLSAPKKMGVVSIVKKYKGIPGGAEKAREEIYGPLGGEDVVRSLYSKSYENIELTIEKAMKKDLGNNDVILYFCPIVFQYKKYVEVEDILADLDGPSMVKKGGSFTISDASQVDKNLMVSEGILEKNANGKWEEIARWQGTGKYGQNTGGKIEQQGEKEGSILYKYMIKTTTGQIATCSKMVMITDQRQMDGKAVLQVPDFSYEGHEFDVYDFSEFTVNGEYIHPQRAYDEGLARNYYHSLADRVRRVEKDAKMTFLKKGNYSIGLEVSLKGGRSLYDTKNIEILKTPYAYVGLGGIQKQNRKQSLNVNIATSPEYPIVEYELEIRDTVSKEIAKISHNKPVYVGSGIKTRQVAFKRDNEHFSSLSLEFLTKYPSYFETGEEERQFEYYLKVKDAKNDEDVQRGVFTVRPDLPPQVNIYMKDLFLREESSNVAKIIAEDISKSDGDIFVRNWNCVKINDLGEEESGYHNISDMEGYEDISLGNKQKISFGKEGVGKFKVKLNVKEEWQEETLPEFISDSDYLKGEGEAGSEVTNIAPRVSVNPLESQEIDLVLIGSEEELKSAKKQENNLQRNLIENGIDANVSYVRFREPQKREEPYEMMANTEFSTGRDNSLAESLYMLGDQDYFYTLQCETYKDAEGGVSGRSPYEIQAKDALNGNIAWRFVVYEDNCKAYVSENGKYFYIVSQNNSKTKLLDRKTGQYIGEIPIIIQGKVFTDKNDERIYIADKEGIGLYNIKGNTYKKLVKEQVYLPHLNNGKITCILKKGQLEFYYATIDLESEEVIEIPYPNIREKLNYKSAGNGIEYLKIEPLHIDTKGNAIFATPKYVGAYEYINAGVWFLELEANKISKIFEKNITDNDEILDIGPVYNEKGEMTEFYYNHFEFDSASNRRYGGGSINILKDGKFHQVFNKRKVYKRENVEIILGHKDTQKDQIYLLKRANCDYDQLLGTVGVTVDGKTYKNLNEPFDRQILATAENYVEQDDYGLFGAWLNYYIIDIKRIRTNSLPLTNEQLLWKIFNKRVNLRNGVGRYVMPLNEEVRSLLKDKGNANKKIDVLENNSLEEVHSEIEALQAKEVGMLLLQGGGKGAEARVRNSEKLKINNKYKYEYTVYNPSETAENILKIAPIGTTSGDKFYERIVERQDFTVPYENGFIKFKGIMLGSDRGATNKGFGNIAARRQYSASFSLEFDMEKDGYMKFDMFGLFEGRDSYYDIYDNGKTLESQWRPSSGIKQREFKLGKGKHVIDFRGYCEYKRTCELGLKNIEIGYYEPIKAMNHHSEILKTGSGKYLVKGIFNATDLYHSFEFSNSTDDKIKISNFKIYGEEDGRAIKQEIYNQEFSDRSECSKWNFTAPKGAVADIVKSKRQLGELEGELVYKKGQLVRYKVNYKDYEADPSKKEYWLYVHTPYNDGKHMKAFAFRNLDGTMKEIRGEELRQVDVNELIEMAEKNKAFIYDKPIDKFYIDGKYTVYHWQEDDTSRGKKPLGNPNYDKKSNICEITFYIEGSSNAPWVKKITTTPIEVELGKEFSINVEIDDLEKENLSLITEVYKKGTRIFLHKAENIIPNAEGNYPLINTGIVTQKAEKGVYKVVCTVSDGSSVGTGKYQILVKESKGIKGKVRHTAEWEKNRQKYNHNVCKIAFDKWVKLSDYVKQKKPRPRGINVFWAGESFVLEAEVFGNPVNVKCEIKGSTYSTNMKQVAEIEDKKIFSGKLWKKDMKKEWAGKEALPLTFIFTATYEDGDKKEFFEEIIIDDSEEFRKLHRKW